MEKTLVLESLFNKVAGLKVCNFIKKTLRHRRFPVKFSRTSFFKKQFWWLLLSIHLRLHKYFLLNMFHVELISWCGILQYIYTRLYQCCFFKYRKARSIRPDVFCKKGVLKILAKIHRKTPVLEYLFNKVAGLKACNFFKRDSNIGAFL